MRASCLGRLQSKSTRSRLLALIPEWTSPELQVENVNSWFLTMAHIVSQSYYCHANCCQSYYWLPNIANFHIIKQKYQNESLLNFNQWMSNPGFLPCKLLPSLIVKSCRLFFASCVHFCEIIVVTCWWLAKTHFLEGSMANSWTSKSHCRLWNHQHHHQYNCHPHNGFWCVMRPGCNANDFPQMTC